MHNNIISFDRARKSASRAASIRSVSEGFRDNVVSIAEWKHRARARRTANGVFFTTGVLATLGGAA